MRLLKEESGVWGQRDRGTLAGEGTERRLELDDRESPEAAMENGHWKGSICWVFQVL